ncbi:MAG: hypothetical protein CME21_22180 [Gemmatimonadetes bacterium]|nr:hypothetical protein [Gemmatimonadota bacterium]
MCAALTRFEGRSNSIMPFTRHAIRLLLISISLTGTAYAGAFEGKRITLDAQISGQPPVNDERRTFPVLSKDNRVLFEVYVEGMARGLTSGFTLAFEDDNLQFSTLFEIESFEGILSNTTGGRGASISVSGKPASLRAPGFLGILTLKARQNVTGATEIRLKAETTTIFDSETGAIDQLDVSDTTIRFVTGQAFGISLDLDTSLGDQARTVRNGVAIGETVEVQVHGNALELMVGYILRFDFDSTMVAFESFIPGNVFSAAQTVKPEVTARSVEVTAATFGGALTVTEGLLGRVFFTTQDSFVSSTTINLITAEMLRSSEFVTAVPRSVTLNGAVDFDGNRIADFRDFLLFAARFGETTSSPNFDTQFDLDGNGSIGFSDFLILVNAIEAGRESQ